MKKPNLSDLTLREKVGQTFIIGTHLWARVKDRKAFLENELFFIAVEDNQWSYAIELIQKGPEYLAGFQKRFYQTYLDAIKNILLDYYGEVSYRRGAWMSGTIKKEEVAV